MESNTYMGIDPGVKGAIAIISARGEVIEKAKLPTDIDKLYNVLIALNYVDCCVVEKVQPRPEQALQGVVTSCVNYGRLQMGLLACGYNAFYVRPQEWQKVLGLTKRWPSDWSQAKRYNHRKNWHKEEAIKLFKKSTLQYADALLIAEYARRAC